jgi:hypothetical protein
MSESLRLEPVGSRAFKNGNVVLTYVPAMAADSRTVG